MTRITLNGENMGVIPNPDPYAQPNEQYRVAYRNLVSKEEAETILQQIIDDGEKANYRDVMIEYPWFQEIIQNGSNWYDEIKASAKRHDLRIHRIVTLEKQNKELLEEIKLSDSILKRDATEIKKLEQTIYKGNIISLQQKEQLVDLASRLSTRALGHSKSLKKIERFQELFDTISIDTTKDDIENELREILKENSNG